MATIVKSISQFQNALNPRLINAMQMTEQEIYDVIMKKVIEYYEEPVFDKMSDPHDYNRTERMKNEMQKSGITTTSNGFQFTVGWGDEYLSFTYPGWATQYGRGLLGKNKATGEDVLNYMNEGWHGGHAFGSGHHFFDEALNELGGERGIMKLFETNMGLCGIPIA